MISPESRLLASQIAEDEIGSHGSKRDLWIKMAEQLVDDGIPKHKVSTNIIKLVTSQMRTQTKNPELRKNVRFNNSWFSLTMTEHGYTDSERGHNKANPETGSDLVPVKKVNEDFVEILDDIRETARMIRDRCKAICDNHGNAVELKDIMNEKNYQSWIKEMRAATKIADIDTDLKTKVPENASWIFKKSMEVNTTLVDIGRTFLQTRIKLNKKFSHFLTTKQATKFMLGKEPNILPVFRPKNRDEAIYALWYGLQCPMCKSWRVQKAKTGSNSLLECIDCNHKFTGKSISRCQECNLMFYDKILDEALKGRCPSCKTPVDLPESVR